jgi:hypothetical protein
MPPACVISTSTDRRHRRSPGLSEPEFDRGFETFLDETFAGKDGARAAVIEHLAWYGVGLDDEAANAVLDLWRRYGFDLNHEGVGYFLDRLGRALSPPIRALGAR